MTARGEYYPDNQLVQRLPELDRTLLPAGRGTFPLPCQMLIVTYRRFTTENTYYHAAANEPVLHSVPQAPNRCSLLRFALLASAACWR